MLGLANTEQARHLMRFFKTGEGDYGEGDVFLGIRVPESRTVVKKYRSEVSLDDVDALTQSPYHEVRLAGFLLLIELYAQACKKNDIAAQKNSINCYLQWLSRGNNWDLVDVVAPKLLGHWVLMNPCDVHVLYELMEMDGRLWHQRVAIVSTWTLIRGGLFEPTLEIARRYLNHSHDLIHKATGWMLREMGKHGGIAQLRDFLDENASKMPRTMLRYAIEKMDRQEALNYMQKK